MPADPYRSPIPSQLWDKIRDEFGLPTLAQVRERLDAVTWIRNRCCASLSASSSKKAPLPWVPVTPGHVSYMQCHR